MLIDLETYRPPVRETPMVSFRRNDNDRRKAEVVLRPNDGPGKRRAAVARELAEKLAAKPSYVAEMPGRYEDRVKERRDQRMVSILAFVATYPEGCSGRKCIAYAQSRPDHVNKILIDLEAQGYISRVLAGGGMNVLNTVTDQGRAYLASLT